MLPWGMRCYHLGYALVTTSCPCATYLMLTDCPASYSHTLKHWDIITFMWGPLRLTPIMVYPSPARRYIWYCMQCAIYSNTSLEATWKNSCVRVLQAWRLHKAVLEEVDQSVSVSEDKRDRWHPSCISNKSGSKTSSCIERPGYREWVQRS